MSNRNGGMIDRGDWISSKDRLEGGGPGTIQEDSCTEMHI